MVELLNHQNDEQGAKGFAELQKDHLDRLRLRFSQKILKKNIPTQLRFELKDSWPGDADRARLLLSGTFDLGGVLLEQHNQPHWDPMGLDEKHIYRLNNFEWLRDLKTLGGEQARQKGRALIAHWIGQNKSAKLKSWRADIMAMRVYNWIAFYGFFCASAAEDFRTLFFESLCEQLHHLARIPTRQLDDMTQIRLGRALTISGLVFEDYHFLKDKGLSLFTDGLKDQILLDGGHISRSPWALIPLLCAAHDVRMALQSAHEKVPLLLQNTIDRMNNALRFFCYNDKYLALFHSSQKGDTRLLNTLLSLAGHRQNLPKSLPQSGFERLCMGRAMVTMDVGNVPPSGHDESYHASALAFEFCYGKQRIFTNCGYHPHSPDWQYALRQAAAHNTAEINGQGSVEISYDGSIGRKPQNVGFENSCGAIINAAHDGFMTSNGIKHYRRIGLENRGKILTGQDHFSYTTGIANPDNTLTIRFHLHPSVRASLTRDHDEVLISLPGGTGFRFFSAGASMQLEESIYLGYGHSPISTKQIVLTRAADKAETTIEWLMKLEELG